MKKIILTLIAFLPLTLSAAPDRVEAIRNDLRRLHLAIALKMESARTQGLTCDTDSYTGDLLVELSKYSTDGAELQRVVRENPELKKDLGRNYAFRRLVMGDSYAVPNLERIKQTLSWSIFYSKSGGAMGPVGVLKFQGDNLVKVGKLDIENDTPKYVYTNASYQVEIQAGEARVIVSTPGEEKIIFEIKATDSVGEFFLNPIGGDEFNGYTTSNFECEA